MKLLNEKEKRKRKFKRLPVEERRELLENIDFYKVKASKKSLLYEAQNIEYTKELHDYLYAED